MCEEARICWGPPENGSLGCFLPGAQGSCCQEAEKDQALTLSKAALSSEWQGPNRGVQGQYNYDGVSETHRPRPSQKMGKMGLFLAVLQALPNHDSLGANSRVLTLSSK